MPRVSFSPAASDPARQRGRRPRPESGQTDADGPNRTTLMMMMIGISRTGLAWPRTKLIATGDAEREGRRERERERERALAGWQRTMENKPISDMGLQMTGVMGLAGRP